jgi:hypothetical protein
VWREELLLAIKTAVVVVVVVVVVAVAVAVVVVVSLINPVIVIASMHSITPMAVVVWNGTVRDPSLPPL